MAMQTGKYKCTLDAASLERAKKELNEDEKNRDGAVETLRSWALQQKWLNTPTDYEFLLPFLRTKKFSQLEARKTLENFWKKRTENRAWYCDNSTRDPKILELLRTGFILRLPHLDKQGRIWLLDRASHLDVDKLLKTYGLQNFFKIYTMLFDWIMMDERSQVNGLCWVVDMGGMTIKHNTSVYTPTNMKHFVELVQGVYPIRTKDVKFYNMPQMFAVVMELAMSFTKDKIKKRMNFHKTMVTIYDSMEMDILPDEYLPDNQTGRSGTVADVVEYMIQELTSDQVAEYINNLSNKDYKVDLKEKPSDLPSESFRKLNID